MNILSETTSWRILIFFFDGKVSKTAVAKVGGKLGSFFWVGTCKIFCLFRKALLMNFPNFVNLEPKLFQICLSKNKQLYWVRKIFMATENPQKLRNSDNFIFSTKNAFLLNNKNYIQQNFSMTVSTNSEMNSVNHLNFRNNNSWNSEVSPPSNSIWQIPLNTILKPSLQNAI